MTMSLLPNSGKSRAVSGIFRALTFSLLFAALACIPAVADPVVQITQCGTVISQPGHYILANDLNCGGPVAPTTGGFNFFGTWGPLQNPMDGSNIPIPNPPSSGDGIDIIADHVDLSLNGHTIDGGGSGNTGISVGNGPTPGNAHVHITGPGTVSNWGVGVGLLEVSFSSVSEVTATGSFAAFVLEGLNSGCSPACDSTKNDIQGNTATNAEFGFILLGASDNTLRDNSASGNAIGIALAFASGNDVRDNTATGNIGGIVLGIFLGPGVATDNDITHNTALGNFEFDLFDSNNNCDSNTWKHNTFGSSNQVSCIN